MKRLLTAFVLPLALSTLSLPAFAALKPGSAVPTVTAPAFLAGQAMTFDLQAMLKKGPVVLYFFPAAFTPGCNVEAAAFSQAADKFKALGAQVVGITAGNIDRLAEFSKDTEKCAGKFPVAADEGARIAKSFDATLALKSDMSSRTSFVIGQNGHIVFVHDDLNPNQHVKQTLDAVTILVQKK